MQQTAHVVDASAASETQTSRTRKFEEVFRGGSGECAGRHNWKKKFRSVCFFPSIPSLTLSESPSHERASLIKLLSEATQGDYGPSYGLALPWQNAPRLAVAATTI